MLRPNLTSLSHGERRDNDKYDIDIDIDIDIDDQPDKSLPWRERGETTAVGATIAASHDAAVAYTSLLKLEHF